MYRVASGRAAAMLVVGTSSGVRMIADILIDEVCQIIVLRSQVSVSPGIQRSTFEFEDSERPRYASHKTLGDRRSRCWRYETNATNCSDLHAKIKFSGNTARDGLHDVVVVLSIATVPASVRTVTDRECPPPSCREPIYWSHCRQTSEGSGNLRAFYNVS